MQRRLKCGLWLVLLLSGGMSLQAQGDLGFGQEERLGIIYNDELSFDIRLHTNGWLAFAMNKAKIRTHYRSTFYHFELGMLRNHKQSRNTDRLYAFGGYEASSYYYGKKNSAFALRAAIGEKRYFSRKQKERGVAIGASYLAGFTLGVLKPYYLDLIVQTGDNAFTVVQTGYTPEYADEFTNVGRIIGHSGFRYGWDGLSVVPGGHAKAGIHLDWGAYDENVKALEFGFMLDVFYKKLPIMVSSDDNRIAMLNVYLSFQFGKRSY